MYPKDITLGWAKRTLESEVRDVQIASLIQMLGGMLSSTTRGTWSEVRDIIRKHTKHDSSYVRDRAFDSFYKVARYTDIPATLALLEHTDPKQRLRGVSPSQRDVLGIHPNVRTRSYSIRT